MAQPSIRDEFDTCSVRRCTWSPAVAPLQSGHMSDLVVVAEQPAYRAPSIVALTADAPPLSELFSFMSEAELRVQSLRMRIRDAVLTARGEEVETIDVALRHPGHARVVHRRGEDLMSRDYDLWITDGEHVKTYDAAGNRASIRPMRRGVVGADRPDLPGFARLYIPRTPLPPESVADAFVHPHGYARNVLVTGPVRMVGTAMLQGREAFIVRADHPRTSQVLTDRPDRWIEVGIDRMTGFMLLLVEHIGDHVSHQAEVTSLELDPHLGDEVFEMYVSSDVRMLY
jgi:hypothetical protein